LFRRPKLTLGCSAEGKEGLTIKALNLDHTVHLFYGGITPAFSSALTIKPLNFDHTVHMCYGGIASTLSSALTTKPHTPLVLSVPSFP
jgi:hypothetical protein